MQNFVVLGIIPGTDYQTNLNFWITVTILFALFASRNQLNAARKQLRTYIAVRRIASTIKRYEFSVSW